MNSSRLSEVLVYGDVLKPPSLSQRHTDMGEQGRDGRSDTILKKISSGAVHQQKKIAGAFLHEVEEILLHT